MPQDHDPVYDVTQDEFEERVLRASSKHTIVADFWAPWCAPCRMLSPALEKVVRSFGGSMVLAKVNVENAPDLASRYGVRGIPAVKIFRNGKIAAEFVGFKPEEEIRGILSRLVPSEVDGIADRAADLERDGRPEDAEPLYRQVIEEEPEHPGALLGLARLALARGDFEAADRLASRVAEDASEHEQAERLLARSGFLRDCALRGGREVAEKAAAEKPQDPACLYALAVCLAAEERHEEALKTLLRVLERDKQYGEGAARKAMVSIFGIVGQRSELADEYRSKLARLIY